MTGHQNDCIACCGRDYPPEPDDSESMAVVIMMMLNSGSTAEGMTSDLCPLHRKVILAGAELAVAQKRAQQAAKAGRLS